MGAITGMTYGIPYPTCERIPRTVGVEWSYETNEYYHGKNLVRLFMDSVVTVNYESEDTQSSGITPALGGSGNLEQVQQVIVEETNDIPKLPRFPGQTLDDELRLLKTCKLAVRFLAKRFTITVSGRGQQAWDETTQGTRPGAVTISSAQGPFSIQFPANGKIEQVGRGQTNDGNPDTWTGTLFHYEPNLGATNQNLISLPSEVEDLLPTNAVYVIQNTQTMAGDVKTNVRQVYQVTAHLAY
jgi:hypothetical protein